MTLRERIDALSAEDQDLLKRRLHLRLDTLSFQDKEATYGRLDTVPQQPIQQPTYQPTQQPSQQPDMKDIPLWQKGLDWAVYPFTLAGMTLRESFTKAPFPISHPLIEAMGWMGMGQEKREQAIGEFPEWIKGYAPAGKAHEEYRELPFLEQMAWEAPAMISTMGVTAAGAAGWLGKLGKGGQVAARALTPAVKAEELVGRAITYPIRKPIEMIGKKLKPARILEDLQPFDELIEVATGPDLQRRIANIPWLKPVSQALGGLAATAETPVEKAIVGRFMLRFEGSNKAKGALATLERLGDTQKIFNLAPDGTIAVGSLRGTHLNTIRTYPQRYANKLTPEQNTWIKQAQTIEEAKSDLLKRYEIPVRELAFDEGGVYAGRRVVGRVSPEGELLDYAYVGAGVGRPGVKAPFEKIRVFTTTEDALKEGFRYLPEEEALYFNTVAAYNRIADKEMADWMLTRVTWRTTAAPEELKIAALAAKNQYNKAQKLQGVINRAIRGERLPESTIMSMERAFPEIGLRDATGNVKALRVLKPKAKSILKEKQAEFWATSRARARAREIAMQPRYGEAMIPEMPAFGGKIFTGPEAKEIVNTFRQQLNPQFSKALHAVNQVNAVGRYFALAGDISPATIQLIFLAGGNPRIYGKALGGFVQAMFNPKFHAKYLAEHNATIQASRGLVFTKGGTTEFTEAMARGGLLRKGPLKIMGKVLEPFMRGFEASLDIAGVEMREAYAHLCTTPARTAQVEAFINEFRGLFNTARIGIPSTQRQLERAAVLAPQYNRAIAILLTDVFRGNLRGDLARKSMAKGITAIAAMTVAVSYAMGESEEEIIAHLNPTSPTFMTWRIAGQNVGPGSKVRSVLKLFANSAKDPEDLLKLSMENPGLRFVRGNLSPVISTGLDLLTGKNFIGDPTRDGLLSISETVLAENLLPIWVQSVLLEGGDFTGRAARGAVEFAGMRGYPMSPSQTRDEIRDRLAQEKYGMSWEEVGTQHGKLAQTKLEQASPELQKATEKAEEYWSERAIGEGKVWTAWREDRQRISGQWKQDIATAAKEFEATQNGVQFRQKVEEANDARRVRYDDIQANAAYSLIYEYFNEPLDEETLAKMNPNDMARRDYYNLMNAPDMYDEFGNYRYDEAEKRKQQFVGQYGQEALGYVEEMEGIRWPKSEQPEIYRLLQRAKIELQPYWEVTDKVWAQYPAGSQQLSEHIENLERTDKRAALELLREHPELLYARRIIAMVRKLLKRKYPQMQQYLNLFYVR